MADVRAVVEVGMASGIASDFVNNRFHFETTDTLGTTLDAIETALEAFYNGFDDNYSVNVVAANSTITFYDLGQPEPRVPLRTTAFNSFAITGTTALPPEVALCLSFEAPRVAGINQQRRRNRVYLGPFSKASVIDTTGRPQGSVRTNIASAADALLAASDSSALWTWCVRSETTGAMAAVTNGWVDDAFDIQRRRGVAPTTRTTFS